MTYYLAARSIAEGIDLGFVELGWFKVLILSIIQGVAGILPISSTAQMRMVTSLFGWKNPGLDFAMVMQLATPIAVFAYFWQDIRDLIGGTIRSIRDSDYQSRAFRLTTGIIVGTIPIGILGLLTGEIINDPSSPLRDLRGIGAACIVMSLLLAIAEFQGSRKRGFAAIGFQDSLWVGVAQALALIPGISRSGATMTMGLFLGMERETAAKFSFLLGLPTVIIVASIELHLLLQSDLNINNWLVLLLGLTGASISAFAAIYWVLDYLRTQSMWVFVWYRMAIGVLLIIGSIKGFIQ
jgi:undecaprenyl-diphosphatase